MTGTKVLSFLVALAVVLGSIMITRAILAPPPVEARFIIELK